MARFMVALSLASAATAFSPAANAVLYSLTSGFYGHNAVGASTIDYFVKAPANQKKWVIDTSGAHYASLDGILKTSADGSFLFKNSLIGTGTSANLAYTSLNVGITNDSAVAQSLQLDSEITPGHIAARDGGDHPLGQAGFNFSIQENTGCGECTFPSLYNMSATITPDGLGFSASDNFYGLNGLTAAKIGNELAYDWSTTNIGIDLGTFAAGQTRNFIYELDTSSAIYSGPNVFNAFANVCDAAQVSFGDPRTKGGNGGSAAVARSLARSFGSTLPPANANQCDVSRVNPFIGLQFGAFNGNVSIVPSGTPVTQPNPDGPINYNAVPEPAASALFGVGALGMLAVRRRRA